MAAALSSRFLQTLRCSRLASVNQNGMMRYSSTVPTDSDTHDDFKPTQKVPSGSTDSLKDLVENDVKENPVMLYMKGVPEAPQCGFSSLAVRVLQKYNVPIGARNILEDPELKNAVKSFRTSGLFLHQLQFPNYYVYAKQRPFVKVPHESTSNQNLFKYNRRYMSNSTVELRADANVVRFSFNNNVPDSKSVPIRTERKWKRAKSSRKTKVNELRFYRLKAKKKMNSPNPEVRIRYKLEKAKRKEEWLLEKLRKYDVPKMPAEAYDPETLTEEEQHYLKRTGEKRKNFVLVGRRGVFGGVVLNMHLHWKKHETVKVICKPCNKPGQIHEYAQELARLSKGIVIDIKPNNAIVLYRGKNYVRPQVMSPVDTLSKDKALEKYRYEQSLEHTSEFIEKLEKELEEYQKYVARYKKKKDEEE